jgi:hypothetical protein
MKGFYMNRRKTRCRIRADRTGTGMAATPVDETAQLLQAPAKRALGPRGRLDDRGHLAAETPDFSIASVDLQIRHHCGLDGLRRNAAVRRAV